MVGDNVTTSASYVSWAGKAHGSNLLYDILYAEGCVFYARTTQPQTVMHLETESNVYGLTVNPYNRNLTPGGSSGGEAAMLGMRGSILVSRQGLNVAQLCHVQFSNPDVVLGCWRRHWRQHPLSSGPCGCLWLQVSSRMLFVINPDQ